jgi:hypothetical protein
MNAQRWARRGVVIALAAITTATAPAVSARVRRPTVPVPEVQGPVGAAGVRGHHFNRSVVPLPEYREDEFFFGGTARTFTVTPEAAAPYTSRMVVRRPADPKAFNGTVFVEWVNVTAQQDFDQHWPPAYQMIMREGAAYVAVSAQAAGIRHLQAWDPIRYASLSHPGDDFSFDVFAQAVAAVRQPFRDGAGPMGRSKVKRVVATGHSQSGGRLHTYVNQVQNRTQVVDAFFLTGQGNPVFDVDTLRTPVIAYMSDAEMSPRVPVPSPWLRVWHVAGTAHNGTWYAHYLADEIARDYGAGQGGAFDESRSGEYGQELNPFMAPPGVVPSVLGCPNPNGSEMPDRYAISAALHHLSRWSRDPNYGTEVPQPPLAQFDEAGNLVRDRFGNVVGGLRLPPIDVPVATYVACGVVVSGTYVFDPVTLRQLYPTSAEYLAKMQTATDAALAAGYILPADAQDLIERARRAFLGQLPPA